MNLVPPEPPEPAAAASDPRVRSAAEAWRQEVYRVVGMSGLGALFGWIFDHALAGFTLTLGLYMALHLKHLRELRLWTEAPKRFELPEPSGIWGQVFERLLEMRRDSRKRKKKLAAILAEFQASTAALPDGAVVLAERGEIAWFNRAAQALLGLRAPQDLGLRIANLLRHPLFAEYLAGGHYEREVEGPSPINRNITLSLRVIPYGNRQRLMIVRDISELRRLETARRDFVSNASHELRTPLTVLRGYLDMIEPEARGQGPLAAWRMPIQEMRNQAARMESLINDMLKLARLESEVYDSRHELIDVGQLLARVMEEARAMSKGSHRFELRADGELRLFGRESEAQSIFSNLVSNAVRYTPTGGVIQVSWMAEASGARFSVADSGIGIAEDDIPRLTERFYRVDIGRSRASGGTGLGLSIVKHALERHEGRLEIESELGVGSTFSCHFPVHRIHRQPVGTPQPAH
ncbi:MAG TPA: phosphate regulon sensor histidine kinase PhoR [Nevskiaceae bacterium]|nr:phosphate regulon sensor histidine kinase PhoR [Nevskiaceae bacterium]